jgi:uncharacterized membrane protein
MSSPNPESNPVRLFPLLGRPLPRISALLRSYFFSGILIVIPIAAIVWIGAAFIDAMWQLQFLLPEAWRPESWISDPSLVAVVDFTIVVGLAGLLALGISILGWISTQYLGKRLLSALSDLIQRIPVLRSVYNALDQLLRTMASGDGKQFSRVVYLEYPRKGVWTLAFVTGPARGPALPPGHLNVYVPTTPNPTSGFHLIVSESEVRDSGLKVEDAFKTILSLGIAQDARAASSTSPATASSFQESHHDGGSRGSI